MSSPTPAHPRRPVPARQSLLAAGLLAVILGALAWAGRPGPATVAASSPSARKVYLPYNVDVGEHAVLWFGPVTETSNHASVRVGYDDGEIILHAHLFDHRLWYDTSPTVDELPSWDAVTLYLSTAGNTGGAPGPESYRFVAQFNPPGHPREPYQAAYVGDGAGWAGSPAAFTTTTGYRGGGFNNGTGASGWWVRFAIPFASLGLTATPAAGENWGLALAVHDRDDEAGTPIGDQVWPEDASGLVPSSWGELQFGLPGYSPGLVAPLGTLTVRHGVDGAIVPDAHVGGHSLCGSGTSWATWGAANFAGYHQINIQNQWDLADWPCYSKYYVTFPLSALPAGRVIASAKVTLYLFGNAGQGLTPPPQPSLIQALTVGDEWDESTITWNNAPLASGYAAAAWVAPVSSPPEWPGLPIEWNVTRAVAEAHAAGQPLRLAFYSADLPYHSGKYFYSSDAGEPARPMLQVVWGEPVEAVAWSYLPLVIAD